MTDAAVDLAELRANLNEYQEQLEQVEALLLDDPQNEEYLGIFQGLEEVVKLTSELIAEAEASGGGAAPSDAPGPSSDAAPHNEQDTAHQPPPSAGGGGGVSLPPQIAQQIRIARQRAALAGQGEMEWAIGARAQARYPADGMWYDAIITGVNPSNGTFAVKFEESGAVEQLPVRDVRENVGAMAQQNATYKGVAAPKMRVATEGTQVLGEMPKWLEIKPTDDERTKAKKRKLIKSYKNKARFQEMDATQTKKAESWKNFVASKSKKKNKGVKLGGSGMFAAPTAPDAKVGVVGSGQGMTSYGKRKRHDFTGVAHDKKRAAE